MDEIKSLKQHQHHSKLAIYAIVAFLALASFVIITISKSVQNEQALTYNSKASEPDYSYIPFPSPTLYPCVTITPTPAYRIIVERPWPTIFVYVTPTTWPTTTPGGPTWVPKPTRDPIPSPTYNPFITPFPTWNGIEPTPGPTGVSAPQPGTKGTPPSITPSPTPLPPCPR